MINFFSETGFELDEATELSVKLERLIINEGFNLGEINYIFCDDNYLLEVNKEYLNHDYYTDIISFDYSENKMISGDIFISIDRVFENSKSFKKTFDNELRRVMFHGLLHFCGYKDKTDSEKEKMRKKEDFYLSFGE